MQRQGAVLEMAAGKERLTFPGPGGYEIRWAPGARHMPLERAPSGHLIIPCDHYDRIPTAKGGILDTSLVFQARAPDSPDPTPPSEGGEVAEQSP